MAESKMKEVAKILGVEMGVSFKVKGDKRNYVLKEDGLHSEESGFYADAILLNLIRGYNKIEQPILDGVEKKYLEGVIRPFKDRVIWIRKSKCANERHIVIKHREIGNYNSEHAIIFPYFFKNTMYKGMKANKEYTLEELGLFQD